MVCHYIKEKGHRYLIPGCWAVVLSGDKKDCTCDYGKEKEDKIKELEKRIERLEKLLKIN